jgi:hypothetical protein
VPHVSAQASVTTAPQLRMATHGRRTHGRAAAAASAPPHPSLLTHAHMPTCPHAHMPTCPHAHMPTCPHAHMPTCPHAHMPTCPRTRPRTLAQPRDAAHDGAEAEDDHQPAAALVRLLGRQLPHGRRGAHAAPGLQGACCRRCARVCARVRVSTSPRCTPQQLFVVLLARVPTCTAHVHAPPRAHAANTRAARDSPGSWPTASCPLAAWTARC